MTLVASRLFKLIFLLKSCSKVWKSALTFTKRSSERSGSAAAAASASAFASSSSRI